VTNGEGASGPTALTPFQVDLATSFFELPASHGFLLAGGAALIAQRLIRRPTRDLDFFTGEGTAVPLARDELERASAARGWQTKRVHDGETFCRLIVQGPEDVLVDLAMDSAAGRSPSVSIAGPTYGIEELAGRKVLALFDRAEARDFADVYSLSQLYGREELLAYAAEVDAGFNRAVFAEMLGSLRRFRDVDLPAEQDAITALRAFFASWRAELIE
jgi:hypothetical protein